MAQDREFLAVVLGPTAGAKITHNYCHLAWSRAARHDLMYEHPQVNVPGMDQWRVSDRSWHGIGDSNRD